MTNNKMKSIINNGFSLSNLFERLIHDQISLKDFLDNMVDEKQREFELYLTKVVENKYDMKDKLEKILSNTKKYKENILYAAFYAQCINYRRMKDYTKLGDIIRKHEYKYQNRPMFNHIYSLFLKNTNNKDDLKEALRRSKKAIDQLENNAGVIHNFAECVAINFEENIIEHDKELLDKAIITIKEAIDLDPNYAKFYCTYGRLLALKHNYHEAKKMIKKAIDMEKSEEKDYSLRIGDYQYCLSSIIFSEYSSQLSKKLSEYNSKTDEVYTDIKEITQKSLVRNLEFLGFFAALVSFIIASIQIISHQSFSNAVMLIIVLCGGLLCTFSSLSLLLNGQSVIIRVVVIFIFGILLIFLAFLIHPRIGGISIIA